MSGVTLEPLDRTNWYKVYDLSVSEEQKAWFPIRNVEWIGISRYEEGGTELFAVKSGGEYAGLIGGGLDEDNISGYINPLMVDRRFQGRGIGGQAMRLMMDRLIRKYHVPHIHVGHRKANIAAGKLYGKLGFAVCSESDESVYRRYPVTYGVDILSLCDCPGRADECADLLRNHFNESTGHHPAQVLAGGGPLPQGYFLQKEGNIIGWTGLHESDAVEGRVYGWAGSLDKEEVTCGDLTPWITPLLIHPGERGNRYGKMLLDHARTEAGKLGYKQVYLTTDHIGYYEKYGFREVGLTTFTWGRPTKVYEHDTVTICEGEQT